ncbi:MAG: hypothetical protein ABF785_04380 [Acetobacter papayae]|uniref:hypothetical protein n=1 Tax=Acetobacter papayae TaxID=1076592 RepID=UPI0039E8CE6C
MTNKSAMTDFEVKDCAYINGTPDADGDVPNFRVGWKSWVPGIPQEEWPEVTRITLQHDVHGEYCMRTRACVWVGEKIIFECPYQALTGVGYAL